jgi:multidrug efflux pump subunit AcrB
MWIVRLALRRPYTIAVMSLMILVLGVLSLTRMVVDILPAIDIPVVMVVWNYPGLAPEDMERRIVLISERSYSTTVNGIERIESQCIPSIGLIKIYFQPGADLATAIAQISSSSNSLLRIAPPGTQAPTILPFNASNVPVAQLTLSGGNLSEQALYDYGLNFIRIRLFTIPGLSTPAPFGGKSRQIMIEADPKALTSRGLSPSDVVNAVQSSNVILPAGTARIGDTEYNVLTNSSPLFLDQFKAIPIKVVGDRLVYIGDVAKVSDSFAEQTNIVRINGRRAAYLAILKHSDASTLAVIEATKKVLPLIKATAPEGMDLKVDFDQSVFVRAAIQSVLHEAISASILVSVMILIFLGSWRSMLIVVVSIPLSIFTSIVGLKLLGHSINLMTLGGLALAVGMLVDDATVEVENIHRNSSLGKPLTVAILDGARQVAVPAIVATLAICVVFFPVVLLYGPAKYLFTPLALAVVIAMAASYLLSRTLVPTMARRLMAGERRQNELKDPPKSAGIFKKMNELRENYFSRFQETYGRLLSAVLAHRPFTLIVTGIIAIVSLSLIFVVGEDFFPSVDAGLIKLHFRAPVGTRLEKTEEMVAQIENRIREVIPADEIETVNSLIGVPIFFNLAFVQTENIGAMDAEILIALKKNHHSSILYKQKLREVLAKSFPGCSFNFQAADIISLVLNFGLTSPINVQVEDRNLDRAYQLAQRIRDSMKEIPGVVDTHINQVLNYPSLQLDVDRSRAALLNMSQRDVANSVLVALSSSTLVSPSFFVNPENNVNYIVAVQVPVKDIDSVGSLRSVPITPPAGNLSQVSANLPTDVPRIAAQPLSNLAAVYHTTSPENISHYTVQRVVDVNAAIEDRDLGSVSRQILRKIDELGPLPPGARVKLRGQYEVMRDSFLSLGLGLILATLFVYFLMVILFQSWLDPFIIMTAVPGALVGILWMLAVTGTTINVESLMGSIMAIGIATSNSILLVSFANDIRVEKGIPAMEAVLEAGKTRLRPVLMTALAMILGMLPMAIAMGEAGEQNAPLGRAVIGGLIMATIYTLFVVPVIYSIFRKKLPTKYLLEKKFLAEERGEEFSPGS